VPLMITGDHPGTAAAIATSVGILGPGQRVVTGRELTAALAGEGLSDVRVYARTAPEQKLDIVEAWRSAGHVVAMTGDGVNDAPALRRADVGVAMGRAGTEVARQAADVVLADDSFPTIVAAIGEGRRVYDNIRRFLLYALAGGTAEVLVMLLGPLVGLALPLLAGQILWVNLLTHGLPGVALGAEQAESSVLERPPRDPAQGVLGGGLWQATGRLGALVAAGTLAVGVLAHRAEDPWQTMVFVALAASQLLVVLGLRSQTAPGWSLRGNPLLYGAVGLDLGLLLLGVYWPPLSDALRTDPLSAGQLGAALAVSGVPLLAVELGKARGRRRTRRLGTSAPAAAAPADAGSS
jgi:Ca2+-transporting ATPase